MYGSDPLTLLNAIEQSAAILLSERLGVLLYRQREDVIKIQTAAVSLIAFLNAPHTRTQDLVDFKTRDQLAAVMGYAEMLLEGEGGLNVMQIERLNAIRANGKLLLLWLDERLNADG